MEPSIEDLLIADYKKFGKLDLLGKLYQPYMALVYGVCLKYLKNRDEAKDAVMDIFEKLAFELKKHDAPLNFRSWLFVVTKNFCLMKLRHEGSESKAFNNFSAEFMQNELTVHPLDEDVTVDMQRALKNCMDKLRENQRIAVELFYYKQLCYRVIAEQLNTDEKKVKSDIQNGKRNLKICLENGSNSKDFN